MASAETTVRPRPVSQLNRKVYLGLYDSRSWPEPDSRDEQRVRDYMVQKYENKRWYVAATDGMKEDAKKANEAALNSKPQTKPLRALLGENAPKLVVGAPAQTAPVSHPPVPVTVPNPAAFKGPPAPVSSQQQPTAPAISTNAKAAASSGFDLLGDLGGDPFSANPPASINNTNAGGFADFSNFDSMSSAPTQPYSAPTPTQTAPPAFPISNTPLQPVAPGAVPPSHPPAAPPASSGMSASDRYAALADLDSAFSVPTTTATSINWGGPEGGGGPINWGSTSTSVPASTPSQSNSGMSWSSTSAGSGTVNWNSAGTGGMPLGSTPPSSGFGVPATVNPFGGGATPGMTVYSSAAPNSTVNPFGPAGMPGVGQFSQAGAVPASTTAPGFGAQFPAAPGQQQQQQQQQQQHAGFAQFPPMQNGGYGMSAQPAGIGGAPVFSQQQFMMPAQQPPVAQHQAGGWGQMGAAAPQQGFGGQPVANPFMNTAMQNQITQPSSTTNPFL